VKRAYRVFQSVRVFGCTVDTVPASKPKHPILAKLRSSKNPFRHLLFEASYEAILLWRSRRKSHCVESYRVKNVFA